jgi:hypothetical protein
VALAAGAVTTNVRPVRRTRSTRGRPESWPVEVLAPNVSPANEMPVREETWGAARRMTEAVPDPADALMPMV